MASDEPAKAGAGKGAGGKRAAKNEAAPETVEPGPGAMEDRAEAGRPTGTPEEDATPPSGQGAWPSGISER